MSPPFIVGLHISRHRLAPRFFLAPGQFCVVNDRGGRRRIRHFVLDTGAGYELKTNKTGAILTFVGATLLTILFWGILLKDVIIAALGIK